MSVFQFTRRGLSNAVVLSKGLVGWLQQNARWNRGEVEQLELRIYNWRPINKQLCPQAFKLGWKTV